MMHLTWIFVLIYLLKGNRFIRVMLKKFLNWWRLIISLARTNELPSIELSWAWEPTYKKELVKIIQAKDPSVVFLAETLTDEARLDTVQRIIEFDHRWVVQREGKGGGLVLFWKSSVNLKIKGSHKYYIDAVIDKHISDQWRFTGFYGEPETTKRSETWNKLRLLNSDLGIPWLCVGDFNDITRQD